MSGSVAPGVIVLDKIFGCSGRARKYSFVALSCFITYLVRFSKTSRSNSLLQVYVGFHMCRVPIGIIENDEGFLNCEDNDEDDDEARCSSWIDQMNNKTKSSARKQLGNMKTIWGFAYAFFMFLR